MKRRFKSAVCLMRIKTKQKMTCCLNYLLPYQAASQAACVSGTNQAAQLSWHGPQRGCVWHGIRAAIPDKSPFERVLLLDAQRGLL